MKRLNNTSQIIETDEISEKTINNFINQKVLIETNGNSHMGILNKFKTNYALFTGDSVKKSFKLNEVTKIIGLNKNTNLLETIVKCGQNKTSYCVHSEKSDKNLGGPYGTKKQAIKRLKQVEYFKHVHENTDLLVKETLLHKFFKVNEEVVNPDNVGKLKPQDSNPRAKRRDRIARSKDNKAVPLPGSGDTEEEAKYRYATYVELQKDKQSGRKKKN